MKIIAASENPAKIEAVARGFERLFVDEQIEVTGVKGESGVADQPFGRDEALRGARNRASNVREKKPDADYWVGVENGIEDIEGRYGTCAWIVILDRSGKEGISQSLLYELPPAITERMKQRGEDSGMAADRVFAKQGLDRGRGTVGILTHDVIGRADYTAEAVVAALIPFINPELYSE